MFKVQETRGKTYLGRERVEENVSLKSTYKIKSRRKVTKGPNQTGRRPDIEVS